MDSICRFLPPKNFTGNLKTVHFVYETEFASMHQPFLRPIYYLHLVTSGEATIFCGEQEHRLTVGSLFFFFPGVPYEIKGNEDFRYLYISFIGACVPELLGSFNISHDRFVLHGFSHLAELWFSSIIRINQKNANVLTESVLLHTLSYIAPKESQRLDKASENLFNVIVDYVDTHYRQSDLTLRIVADIFSYTEKYLSHFFKTKMGTGFNEYVTDLRLQYANRLINEGVTTVSEIATESGFSDPLYFSKVFKKKMGASPSEYILKTQQQ